MSVESVKKNTDTLYFFVKVNNELRGESNGHFDLSDSKLVYFWKD
ncbi:MAG TPA: hypothetical protein VHP30_16260 [Ignavibacteriales bacterium]|nr:hypothetical protein [Ignavibacteriales bacterium]